MIRKCFLDLSSFVHKYIWEPFLGTHLRVKVNYQWQSFQKKKKKRVSGLTLISNQILQKGTARTAAVLFPGLITFHCSLLMSQLSLSAHSPGSSGGLAVGQTASDSSIYIRGCLLCKDFQRLKKKNPFIFMCFHATNVLTNKFLFGQVFSAQATGFTTRRWKTPSPRKGQTSQLQQKALSSWFLSVVTMTPWGWDGTQKFTTSFPGKKPF